MSTASHAPADYRERDVVPVRRALVSVSDKTDLDHRVLRWQPLVLRSSQLGPQPKRWRPLVLR